MGMRLGGLPTATRWGYLTWSPFRLLFDVYLLSWYTLVAVQQ